MTDAKREGKRQPVLTGYVSTVEVPPKKIPDSSIHSLAAKIFFEDRGLTEMDEGGKRDEWGQAFEQRQKAREDIQGEDAVEFLEGIKDQLLTVTDGGAALWAEELERRKAAEAKKAPDQIKVIFLHINELLFKEAAGIDEQLNALVQSVAEAITREKPDFISLRGVGTDDGSSEFLTKLQTALGDSEFAVQMPEPGKKCVVLYNKNVHKPLSEPYNFQKAGEDPVFFFQRQKEGYDPIFVNMMSMSPNPASYFTQAVNAFTQCATSPRGETTSQDTGLGYVIRPGDTVGIMDGNVAKMGARYGCFYISSRQGEPGFVKVDSQELEPLVLKPPADKRPAEPAPSASPQPPAPDSSSGGDAAGHPEQEARLSNPPAPPKPWLTVLGISLLAIVAGGAVVKGSLNLLNEKEMSKLFAHVSKDVSIGMVAGGVVLLAVACVAARFAYTKRQETLADFESSHFLVR